MDRLTDRPVGRDRLIEIEDDQLDQISGGAINVFIDDPKQITKMYLLNPPLGRKTLSCQWVMKRMQYVYRSNNLRRSPTSHWLCHALLGCRSRVKYSPEGRYLFSSGGRLDFSSLYQCDSPTGVG